MSPSQSLFRAIASGNLGRVAELVKEDPEVAGARNEQGVSAVMTALYHRRPDIADVLVGSGVRLDTMELIALGKMKDVEQRLEANPSTSAKSPDGFSPTHYAAFFDRPDIMALLLEHGADVDVTADNAMQVQPLHSAVAVRSMGCIRLLLQAGAPVNAKQQQGWTAIHSAAKHGDAELTSLLLEHGADPNQPADNGQTAIDMATAEGHAAVVALMQSHAA